MQQSMHSSCLTPHLTPHLHAWQHWSSCPPLRVIAGCRLPRTSEGRAVAATVRQAALARGDPASELPTLLAAAAAAHSAHSTSHSRAGAVAEPAAAEGLVATFAAELLLLLQMQLSRLGAEELVAVVQVRRAACQVAAAAM